MAHYKNIWQNEQSHTRTLFAEGDENVNAINAALCKIVFDFFPSKSS